MHAVEGQSRGAFAMACGLMHRSWVEPSVFPIASADAHLVVDRIRRAPF